MDSLNSGVPNSNSTFHHQGVNLSQKAEKRCCCNVSRSLYAMENVFYVRDRLRRLAVTSGRREAVRCACAVALS